MKGSVELSAEAQAYLAPRPPPLPTPDVLDAAAWRAYAAAINGPAERAYAVIAERLPCTSGDEVVAGVQVYSASPPRLVPAAVGKTVIYFHGGGLALFAGAIGRSFARIEAARLGCRVISIDYRVPPTAPFPAALDDCLCVYRQILSEQRPQTIAFYGVSGGANLALATCFRARTEGLALPASLVLCAPQIDLTESGDSFQTNRELDLDLPGGTAHFAALYAPGRDLADPLISPLFGEFTGFPPTHIQSGTRDLMLSNAVRLHQKMRAANCAADLYVLESGLHGGLSNAAPETEEAMRQIAGFIGRTIGPAQP